jgi:large subunit ribosomal protein L22
MKEEIIVADEKEKKVATKKTTTAKATTAKKETAEKKTTAKKTTTTAKKTVAKKATETKATTKAATEKKTTTKAAAKTETAKAEVKTAKAPVKKANKEVKAVDSAKATVKYARISARKVKIVADLIRGKDVDEALAILQFTPKAGTEVLYKLLKSAIANAENNYNMTHSKLYIAEIYSNQGPTLKRIRAAAKGSAVRIRKRTSNTTIVLKERD